MSVEAAKPPPPHISPVGMWASKLGLRIIQFALAVAIIGCVGSISSTGIWSLPTLIVIMPQAAVSAIWSLAEGISILVRGGRRGIHPGANVALDLLLWLGLAGGTVALWLLGIATMVVQGSLGGGWGFNWSDYDSYTGGGDISGKLSSVAGMGQALIGLGATLTILHFATFVIACVETNKRNRAKRQPQVVYVNGGSQYPPQYGQPVQGVGYSPAQPEQVYHHAGMKA